MLNRRFDVAYIDILLYLCKRNEQPAHSGVRCSLIRFVRILKRFASHSALLLSGKVKGIGNTAK